MKPDGSDAPMLTFREKQVAYLLGQRKRISQIAVELGLNRSTVGHVRKTIYQKLGLSDDQQVAAWVEANPQEFAVILQEAPSLPPSRSDAVPEWVKIRGVVYPGQEKAPFVRSGYGVKGALAYMPNEDLLGCHECGAFVPNLAWHARAEHSVSAGEYRVRHGLRNVTPLVNRQISEICRLNRVRALADPNRVIRKPDARKKKEEGPDLYALKWELRNERGTCHAQMVARIRSLAHDDIAPTKHELAQAGIHLKSMLYAFDVDTLDEVMIKVGLIPRSMGEVEKLKTYLLEAIRDFYVKRQVLPNYRDFGNGALPPRHVYLKFFGSLRESLIAAGFGLVIDRRAPGGPPPGQTGIRGVSQDRGQYSVRIWENGKRRNLGRFDTKEEAILVRHAAEKRIYANGGRPGVEHESGGD